jgi:hypothetical protein
MPGIFPLGDHTIMTTDTITADAHMIVARPHPGNRVVTVVAGIPADDMPGILALRDNTVVATLTTSNYCNVVNSKYIGPYRGRVTNLAFTDDPYMPGGWSTGFYPA